MFGKPKTPAPPPPPPPPPNPPSYANAMGARPSNNMGPLGGLASTILTSPTGVLQPASVGKKTLLGG